MKKLLLMCALCVGCAKPDVNYTVTVLDQNAGGATKYSCFDVAFVEHKLACSHADDWFLDVFDSASIVIVDTIK